MAMNKFVPKELSWLSFNARVLQEAADKSVPLIERVRFLGIYSNNQDEFFKVRVADLKRQVIINKEQGSAKSEEAAKLLKQVQTAASDFQKVQNKVYRDLMAELAEHKIFLRNEKEISAEQKTWVQRYFKRHVLKHINPVLVTENIDLVSFLRDQYTYLLVKMTGKKSDSYALIEIPSDVVPRFLRLPSQEGDTTLMFLDDVIRLGLDIIFRGFFDYTTIEAYSIKMNRDAEYDLLGNVDKSIIENMTEALKQRLDAIPVRFAYDRDMPKEMVETMAQKLHMSAIDSLMPGNRYHNFKDFLSFPSISDEYENASLQSVPSAAFDLAQTPFEAITKGDVLLYYPYYSFEYFTEVLRQASYDPKVHSIKINIYRVASNSRVIDSLIHAANNGKRVTVVVELKARFDEANNIKWASRLTDAGVKVLFGLPTLKIHSKLCLITRKENDEMVRYAHIGTGNFNEKTAKIYTDFALFTKNQEIASEVESVFEFIEYPYTRPRFKHLLVSPLNARKRIYSMIDREIEHAKTGFPAYINLKVNNLVDSGLIEKLYEASQAGVRIRAIVRGMCALRPGVPELSENIYITSIVDRFLEHPRVMVFCNNNNPELYISSADWMTRNLDYRIEVGAPVLDPTLRDRIMTIFRIQCNDNQKARVIDSEQQNNYAIADSGAEAPEVRSQIAIQQYLSELETALLGKDDSDSKKKEKKSK
ncbi:MAG: polyphosphate kinase 1 [Candidatus Anaerobiospirillum merdipullorum]|uniref:Polyphosphate kinase n=1 Tax=Candidatus Anaerobiospirillum merdipullorum TaxID=2838450 RepID=A0A9E2KPX4_9GAMM|nr:polyphosphate kinase 1 [Candidatus Anaerobiospirillum merdipullorum]